jgi:DNA-binding SARP family transcriptional activator
MVVLKILLLGTPETRWNNEIFTIPRRIPRAMLYYLAVGRNMVSRDEIVSLLWDDTTPLAKAKLRFNESLSRLRSSLPSAELLIT